MNVVLSFVVLQDVAGDTLVDDFVLTDSVSAAETSSAESPADQQVKTRPYYWLFSEGIHSLICIPFIISYQLYAL